PRAPVAPPASQAKPRHGAPPTARAITRMVSEPNWPYTNPITSGGTNPPRPPAAPTTPVTDPTLSAGASNATSANVAPLAAPSAAAMDRNAIVPVGTREGADDCTSAPTATMLRAPARTQVGANRSESHPPTGRISTASNTNPAIRFAASACASPYPVLRYDGR